MPSSGRPRTTLAHQGVFVTSPTRHGCWFGWASGVRMAACLAFLARCPPAFAQDSLASVGVEVAFKSGHADRGFIVSDRAVLQPVAWVFRPVAESAVWGGIPLA